MPLSKVLPYIENENYERLSPEIITKAKKSLLDFLASAYSGYQCKSSDIAFQSADWLGGKEHCSIIGTEKTVSPFAATFINATLASCMDIDDGHREPVGHPGCMIIPPVLAAGELSKNSTGKDFITAIVTGYEVGIRCGIVMNSNHGQLFYGSGGWALFGSASGLAKMKSLTGITLENALTIGEVYGPTAQCGKSIAAGSMTKESVGWGAVTAFMGVSLAEHGFTGPDNILIDKHLYNCDIEKTFETLGEKYEIRNTYFKQYPACKWAHSPITAVLQIMEESNPDLKEIDEIIIETFQKATTLNHVKPETTEAAQYSIPFLVATALYYGAVEPSHISEKHLKNDSIYNLAKKIRMIPVEDMEKEFPSKRPARVKIKMKNKSVFIKEVKLIKGDPENPLSWDDLINKFHLCSKNFIDYAHREEIVKKIINLERITNLKELTSLLK
ncbi:MmgE/PrpD family protein [Oceanobacillus jeddahense]|uniref:MmgE/PrpD family protein n=1 Tax=Oceanobacillus jeddahense TaxID=1462527 RepID=A0ABY5JYM4_9BACI|nr:MmgE/PrpD family protein [Oceanobacillus jeddahense]UUI04253.1 MmgE/PrpD family protein [Oceanobacillus jeddahense]